MPRAQRWLLKLVFLCMALIRGRLKAMARKYPRQYDEQALKLALAEIRTRIRASGSGYLVGHTVHLAGVCSLFTAGLRFLMFLLLAHSVCQHFLWQLHVTWYCRRWRIGLVID